MKYWRKALDQDRVKPSHGRIEILKDRCKGCRFCIEFCPKKVYELSDELNSKGYQLPRIAKPDDCSECRQCDLYCPEFAIVLEEITEA